MPKPHMLLESARSVARQINPVERAIDDSLAKAASLLASLPVAGEAADLPASVGHSGLIRVVATINAIATARGEMIAAHEEFAATREYLRLPTRAFGSPEGCPTKAELSLVGSVAA